MDTLAPVGAQPLAGQAAIVTGAGTGLGAAVATVLARAGATVVINGRREGKLQEVAAEIRQAGGMVLVQPGDVSRPADVQALVDATAAACGRVDILVNNAARLAQFRPTHAVTLADFDDFLAVDLRGPFMLTQAVVPHMLRQGGGAIVNIASMAGIVGLKYAAPYCAAKGGLVQLTRAVALDYADQGIRVNCVCPGGMEPTDPLAGLPPEDVERAMEAVQPGSPVGRRAQTLDVAELVLFLAGPHSACMTGAIIPFDGGYTAR